MYGYGLYFERNLFSDRIVTRKECVAYENYLVWDCFFTN